MCALYSSSVSLALDELVFQPRTPPLTFNMRKGECLALLGIGSYQHDILHLTETLIGRRAPLSGAIYVVGTDVTSYTSSLRGIASVGPQAPLFPHLSVFENILFPLQASGKFSITSMRRYGHEVMALTGLDALRDTKVSQISALDYFRAALARALVCNPAILVLYRPFSGLFYPDNEQAINILDRLRHALGLNILLLTRRRNEAFMLADRTGIMENGTLIQLNTAPALLERPATRSVAITMSNANVLTGKVIEMGEDTVRLRLPTGETVEAMYTPALMENDLATICIPPDKISLLFLKQPPSDPLEEGDILCSLVSSHHLGHTIMIRLRLSDRTEVLVKRPPIHTRSELKPNRQVLLAWQARNAIAFPMDQNNT